MKTFNIIIYSVLFIFSSEFSYLNANEKEILSPEDHCVAYTTPEKILFFSEYLVIGKNCEIQTSIENNGIQSKLIVNIPIKSFDSGINARDEDVIEILKGKKFPNIRFESDWLSRKKIKKILLGGPEDIKGF